jgi:hypothetical protein
MLININEVKALKKKGKGKCLWQRYLWDYRY